MALTLDELSTLIPRVVPSRKELSGLKVDATANVVTFTWNKRHFLAKPTLEVFELRPDGKIYITGSSLLMTRVLLSSDRNGNTVEAVLKTLEEATDYLRANKVESGLELLGAAKKVLSSLQSAASRTPARPVAKTQALS